MKRVKHGYLKRYLYAVMLFIGIGLFFSSCEDWLENKNEYLYRRYGVVNKTGEDVFITLDRGSVLYPESSRYHMASLKDGERIIVDFTVNEVLEKDPPEFQVKVYDVYKVLTKDVVQYSEEAADSLGADPLRINDVWIRNGFVNVDFTFLGGKPGQKHMVNLMQLPKEEGEEFYAFEFRHHAFEDHYMNRQRGVVSFRLNSVVLDEPLPESTEKIIPLKIKYITFNGKEKVIDLKWKLMTDEETEDEERSVLLDELSQEDIY